MLAAVGVCPHAPFFVSFFARNFLIFSDLFNFF